MLTAEQRLYARRNRVLRQMGFPSYQAYLRSPLWGRIRASQLIQHPDCYGCGGLVEEVHHGDYSRQTLEGKKPKALYSVCGRCHRTCEWSPGEGKVGPARATQRLKAMRKARLEGRAPEKSRRREPRPPREVAEQDKLWLQRYRHLMDDEPEAVVP